MVAYPPPRVPIEGPRGTNVDPHNVEVNFVSGVEEFKFRFARVGHVGATVDERHSAPGVGVTAHPRRFHALARSRRTQFEKSHTPVKV